MEKTPGDGKESRTILVVLGYAAEIALPESMTETQFKSSHDVVAPSCMMVFLECFGQDMESISLAPVTVELLPSQSLYTVSEIEHGLPAPPTSTTPSVH